MARYEPEQIVTLSLLDRLVNTDLNARADPPMSRNQSLRQLKASLRRDLEWLLNTRRSIEGVDDTQLEIQRSLHNYGLPDITGLTMNSVQDQNRLLWMLESTVSAFEPRIAGARVTLEPVTPHSRVLRFQIQGLLRIDPAPERVTFDTTLELTSGQYEVKGE